MGKAEIILRYLQVILRWPVVFLILGVIFLKGFKVPINVQGFPQIYSLDFIQHYNINILQLVIETISALAAVVACIVIGIAARQLSFNCWLKAQEIFTEGSFTKARGRVYSRIPSGTNQSSKESSKEWTDDDFLVCRKMDELARLAPYLGFFGSGEKLMLKTWLDPLAKSWIVLHSLVCEERKKTPKWQKWDAFEKLGKEAAKQLGMEELAKEQLLPLAKVNPETSHIEEVMKKLVKICSEK